MPKPVVLCILDGWGLSHQPTSNAPLLADTPNFDRIMRDCPNATLTAHGPDVGLPDGQMGNSEVGHMNIGAGRVVWMDLPRINNAIADGSFAKNAVLSDFCERLKINGGVAHVAGLLSDGGVHSHIDHMIEMVRVLSDSGISVALHVYLDGRDVAPKSAGQYLETLEKNLPSGAVIATITGRFFAMDRDNRWDRVEKAYHAMVTGDGLAFKNSSKALEDAYKRDETDEFVSPSIIGDYDGMNAGDGLIFTNFRADRAREILNALLDPNFDGFSSADQPSLSAVCGMVEYSDDLNTMMDAMFASQEIKNTLGQWVSSKGLSQYRLAETEKYPHVTFFMNGGVEVPNKNEQRYMAASPKVKTYDMKPEMSAEEVSDALVAAIEGQNHDLILVNYANPDMVGHTGDLSAAIAACAAVDLGLGRALKALENVGGSMIVTADHGNCEVMTDPETGGAHTAHTTNPVPVALIGSSPGISLRKGGRLGDLAPTLLDLLGLEKPPEMTGKTLIQR